jgi:hypothetical protein
LKLRTQAEEQTKQERQQQQRNENEPSSSLIKKHPPLQPTQKDVLLKFDLQMIWDSSEAKN